MAAPCSACLRRIPPRMLSSACKQELRTIVGPGQVGLFRPGVDWSESRLASSIIGVLAWTSWQTGVMSNADQVVNLNTAKRSAERSDVGLPRAICMNSGNVTMLKAEGGIDDHSRRPSRLDARSPDLGQIYIASTGLARLKLSGARVLMIELRWKLLSPCAPCARPEPHPLAEAFNPNGERFSGTDLRAAKSQRQQSEAIGILAAGVRRMRPAGAQPLVRAEQSSTRA